MPCRTVPSHSVMRKVRRQHLQRVHHKRRPRPSHTASTWTNSDRSTCPRRMPWSSRHVSCRPAPESCSVHRRFDAGRMGAPPNMPRASASTEQRDGPPEADAHRESFGIGSGWYKRKEEARCSGPKRVLIGSELPGLVLEGTSSRPKLYSDETDRVELLRFNGGDSAVKREEDGPGERGRLGPEKVRGDIGRLGFGLVTTARAEGREKVASKSLSGDGSGLLDRVGDMAGVVMGDRAGVQGSELSQSSSRDETELRREGACCSASNRAKALRCVCARSVQTGSRFAQSELTDVSVSSSAPDSASRSRKEV
jgi:hypothetical protein